MINNKDYFKKNKYCVVNNAISKEMAAVAETYAIIDENNNFSPEGQGLQVPNAHSKYADFLMESLLVNLLPVVEENTGVSLYPTYSYYRVYRVGDDLKPHIDRPACEISATLCLGYNYDDSEISWPIFLEDKDFSMKPGDMVIYRGIELNHYRNFFIAPQESYHIQCFLHYVDKNGTYSDWKLDKRRFLGNKTRN